MNIPEGLARYLAARNIGITYSNNAGGNAFIDALPVISQATGVTVGFYHVGGVESDSGHPYQRPTLQIIVRGTIDPRTGIDMWQAIYDELHGLSNMILPNGDHLISCIVIQSGPVRIGADETGRFRYAMNLRCEVFTGAES